MPALSKNGKAAARDLQLLLQWLIRISDAAEGKILRHILLIGQLSSQQGWRVFFDHDAALEIHPSREAEPLVCGPGIAVGTAMLAAAIRVQTRSEGQVRAVMPRDDGTGVITKYLRSHSGWLFTRIILHLKLGEALLRIHRRTAAMRTDSRQGRRLHGSSGQAAARVSQGIVTEERRRASALKATSSNALKLRSLISELFRKAQVGAYAGKPTVSACTQPSKVFA